jgi:hypothetical protein
MATTINERVEYDLTVHAHSAVTAWINAFLAASQDEENHRLYRTLSVEFYEGGIQFIGCDGHALFRAWAPVEPGDAWPGDDAQPLHSCVVMDPDGFGIGFMKSLHRVTGEEGHVRDTLTISTAPHDDEATIALGSEFMTERMTIRACGQRLDLKLYEGGYVNWRGAQLGVEAAERVDGLTLAPKLFQMVGKIKGASAVDLDFFGTTHHVAFRARGEAEVRGLLMPMRRVG